MERWKELFNHEGREQLDEMWMRIGEYKFNTFKFTHVANCRGSRRTDHYEAFVFVERISMQHRFHGGHDDCSGWWAEDSDVMDEGIIKRHGYRVRQIWEKLEVRQRGMESEHGQVLTGENNENRNSREKEALQCTVELEQMLETTFERFLTRCRGMHVLLRLEECTADGHRTPSARDTQKGLEWVLAKIEMGAC